ncbi:putative FAD dependent oxidoreductase-containing protein [Homarus americanus]|uniref:Putative FAD dependent oxidoreductase-containing protein n=2 Tax=Homarus americanus TaxID=6706 RepID=A0A8J5TIS9_HOMAM|nr:putative FAD dependent oxidoreductase-containing protein [Homarus americanus]
MSAPEEKIYDLIVVGAGMIGSAAAHHASQIPNTTVCLVGPPEPKVRKGQDIFGCWFDEGRLCYQINRNKIWCNLGAKSLARFRDLEKLTGVKFYTESGYAYVTLDKSTLENLMEVNQKCGFEAQDITNSWKNIFPFLHLPDNASVVWQSVNGGHIIPRKLVTAHQTAAQMCDAQILHKIVSTVLPSKCDTHK